MRLLAFILLSSTGLALASCSSQRASRVDAGSSGPGVVVPREPAGGGSDPAGPAVGDGTADTDPRPSALGETRALVLWVRFADDGADWTAGPTEALREWGLGDGLPLLASSILTDDLSNPTGLTRYFLDQSLGRFRLTGTSFPEVLVSRQPEASYRQPDGTLDQDRLTEELLRAVDADPRLDLDDFDADQDGYLDYLFILVRRMQTARLYPSHASGVSDLGYTSPAPEFGSSTQIQVNRHATGSYVRYGSAGIIFPETDLIRLMAHELGHDLWRDYVHLAPLPGARGAAAFGERTVGYVLMSGSSDARGDETISAPERHALDWISCTPLVRDTTVTVTDLYSAPGSACFTAQTPALGPRRSPRTLYFSHRARIGPWDRLRSESHPSAASDQGLMDTGLLVLAREGRHRIGPIPADGTLELSAKAAPYHGDLFRPGQRLTPWTSPNSSGYLGHPTGYSQPAADGGRQGAFQGFHVEAGGDESQSKLVFVADERAGAAFQDGDVIPDIPGLLFSGLGTVTGSVLLEGSAEFEDGLLVRPGGQLRITGQARLSRLVLQEGSRLTLLGVLDAQTLENSAGSIIELGDGSDISGAAAGDIRQAAQN